MEWAEEGQRGVTPLFELGYKKAVVEVGKKPQEVGVLQQMSRKPRVTAQGKQGERELHDSE